MQHALAVINKVLFIPPVFHLLANHLLIFREGGPSDQKSAKICLMYVSGGGKARRLQYATNEKRRAARLYDCLSLLD